MSYVGTAKKHGVNAFTAIQAALNDNPDIIFEQLGSEQLQNKYSANFYLTESAYILLQIFVYFCCILIMQKNTGWYQEGKGIKWQ